jgi:Family of unknown function (DUF6788)
MNPRQLSLEARIATLKQAIVRLGDLRPGKLSQQYNVCGKADCRCKADPPQKHGPYYQLSFTRNGKSSTQFVRKEDLPVVRQQLRNYQRLRELIDRWITLGMELSRLKLEQPSERSRSVSPKRLEAETVVQRRSKKPISGPRTLCKALTARASEFRDRNELETCQSRESYAPGIAAAFGRGVADSYDTIADIRILGALLGLQTH